MKCAVCGRDEAVLYPPKDGERNFERGECILCADEDQRKQKPVFCDGDFRPGLTSRLGMGCDRKVASDYDRWSSDERAKDSRQF
jgi:hypothetical protein